MERPTRVRLKGFSVPGRFAPLDLKVGKGEIVAIVGQLGSGADIVVEALAGLRRGYVGAVEVDGVDVEARSTAEAIGQGIAYVPEDRAGKGVFLDATVETNITTSVLDRVTRFGFLQFGKASERAASRRPLHHRPKRLPSEVSQLSGGNQQKVAIAKAVALDPRVLLLNEPTRGVDIGARTEIYRQLQELAKTGMVVVFFTTDIEEVHELADRVVTIFRGRSWPTAAVLTPAWTMSSPTSSTAP